MRGEFDGLEYEKDSTEKQNTGKQLRSYIITFICVACAVYSLCGFYHQQKTGELFFFLGYRPVVIVSGSMEETIQTGAIVLTKKTTDIQEGDIIFFKNGDNLPIVHRCVRIEGDQYYTKGDKNKSEVTVEARWTAKTLTYNVQYVSSSGKTLGSSTVSGAFGTTKEVEAPAKTGYATPNKQSVVFDSETAKTIKFVYTPTTYNITLKNATTNGTDKKIPYTIETPTFLLESPSKTGYTFTGWTGSNGSTPQSTVIISQGSTGDRVYTANWKASTLTYTIEYYSSTGKYLGSSSVTGQVGTSQTVSAPTKTGYRTPSSQEIYFDIAGRTVEFTYTPITYYISYYGVEGATNSNPSRYNIETPTFYIDAPYKSGYIFKGWTGSNGSTPQTSVSIIQGSTGNKSYAASWQQDVITIKIWYQSTEGYTLGTDIVTGTLGETKMVFPRTFSGYNTPPAQYVTFSLYTPDVVFTYEPSGGSGGDGGSSTRYTITYDVNGGDPQPPTAMTWYTFGMPDFTIFTPRRSGYTFLGWTGSNGSTPQKTVTVRTGTTGNLHYTANWARSYSEDDTKIASSKNNLSNKNVVVLETGSAFKADLLRIMNETSIRTIQFVNNNVEMNGSYMTDVSANQDGTIMMCAKDDASRLGMNIYVYTTVPDAKIQLNADSTNMWSDLHNNDKVTVDFGKNVVDDSLIQNMPFPTDSKLRFTGDDICGFVSHVAQ